LWLYLRRCCLHQRGLTTGFSREPAPRRPSNLRAQIVILEEIETPVPRTLSRGSLMSMQNRTILGCLGVISLALVGTGTLVFLKRDTVVKNLIEAWDTQAERT